MNILSFKKMKKNQEKISMITCYDYTSATIVAKSNIDCILVGDSAVMVMHGEKTTIPATVDAIAEHTKAVVKGAESKFIIADMPFLSYRKGLNYAMDCVEKLMHAGANAIKLEGIAGNEEIIQHIINSGVPVMGHLGLTPQSVHQLGGFKVQGKSDKQAERIINEAKKLEDLGCFAIVLECIPEHLAKTITEGLRIATIGIGAGSSVDGQVLVFQDALGLNLDFTPKFVKKYLNGAEIIKNALNDYDTEVKHLDFPTSEHTFL